MYKRICCLFVVLNGISLPAFSQTVDQADAEAIKKFADTDWQSLTNAIAKGDQNAEISCFIDLADHIKNQMSDVNALRRTKAQRRDLTYAYRSVWNMGIKMLATVSVTEDKQKLLTYWNKGLQESSANIQIAALGQTMNRKLLTPEFWLLLKRTQDDSMLNAFAYYVWKQGDDSDVGRISEKIALLHSGKQK
jgi:hypothetical protein